MHLRKLVRVVFTSMIALWWVQAMAQRSVAAPRGSIKGELMSDPITMFRWSEDRCESNDTPDSQARAFRDAHGAMHLFSVNDVAYPFIGPDLTHLRHQCKRAFQSSLSTDSSRFADYSWLASTYTEDGTTIYALFHNEFHGWDSPTQCPSHSPRRCFYVSTLEGISSDGGNTFHVSDNAIVVTSPYRYEADSGFVGYMNPSNIINYEDYYYFAIGALGYHAQHGGICLFRTKTIQDPNSWRAWDGHDFAATIANPYKQRVENPDKHVCQPVDNTVTGLQAVSIFRYLPNGLFVMVGLKNAAERHGGRRFLAPYVSFSRNLLKWSSPSPLLTPADEERLGSTWYPTFIDPSSADRNFATIGDVVQLIFVRLNNSRDWRDRDMLRVPVRLQINIPSD